MLVAFSKSSILPRPLQGPVAIGLQILGQVQALKAASALGSERVAQMPPVHFFLTAVTLGESRPFLTCHIGLVGDLTSVHL